jgi:hypothetical protein
VHCASTGAPHPTREEPVFNETVALVPARKVEVVLFDTPPNLSGMDAINAG